MQDPTKIDNRFRLFFGMQFAAIGIFFPYIALYFSSIGLTGAQTGLLLALVPFVAFLVQPLWGLATDIYHQHQRMLVWSCVGVTLSVLGMSQVQSFWLIVLFTVLHAVMMAPVSILITALALEHLERQASSASFGSLRLWGSIGFAISTFGIGSLFIDAQRVWWILPLYAMAYLVLAGIALTIPNADIHAQVSWREGVGLIGRNPTLAYFLFALTLIGMTLGIVNNYFAVYLTDIKAAGWIIGAALAISAIGEVPLMARTQQFVDRWGVRLVLVAGASLLPLRWLLYAIIDQPLWVLPVQLIHSVAMMSLLIVGVLYVDRLLEPKWRTSGQSLYAAALHGIGPGIGLYIGGLLYGANGIRTVWLFSTVIATLGVVILGWAIYKSSN